MSDNQQRAAELFDNTLGQRDEWMEALTAALDAAEARGRAEAWDDGYRAAQLDADEQPYSDRPEAATWKPRANPYRDGAREGIWLR